MKILKKKNRGVSKNNFIHVNKDNLEVLKKIISSSGFSWHERYYMNANMYFTCLQIHDFMVVSYRGFMNDIIKMENVYVTADISHMAMDTYESKFEKITSKHENKMDESRKFRDFKKARKSQKEVQVFDEYIDNTKESVKTLTVRVYIFDKTLDLLQDRLFKVINELSRNDMKGYVQLNDLASDVKALTSQSDDVKKMVASSTIAEIMYRSDVSVVDDNIAIVGKTANGIYAPNIYSFRNYSYNKAMIGGMGSGKSACLKLLTETMQLRNSHVVYIFDIHNEYKDYAKELGIPSVTFNEKHHINFMQMFFVNNDLDDDVIRKEDINNKITCNVSTVSSYGGFTNETTKKLITNYFFDFYKDYEGKRLSEIKRNEWGLLEDVYKSVHKEFVEMQSSVEEYKNDIYKIDVTLKSMVDNYAELFNSVTNMSFDLNKSIRFDVSFLKNNSDYKLKGSYMSLLLDYVSYGLQLNLTNNNRLMKEMGVYPFQLKEPLITHEVLIDETLEFAKDRGFLERCLSNMKFMRKAYSGLSIVIHATTDVEKDMENNGDLLSQLFELCTNKFIGFIEGKSLSVLPRLVKDINDNDIRTIAKIKKAKGSDEREFFIIDDQKRKIKIKTLVTPYQRTYFGGGV